MKIRWGIVGLFVLALIAGLGLMFYNPSISASELSRAVSPQPGDSWNWRPVVALVLSAVFYVIAPIWACVVLLRDVIKGERRKTNRK